MFLHPFLQSMPPVRWIFNGNLKNNILVYRGFLWGHLIHFSFFLRLVKLLD
jgi:hypothetical protein